jgi:hypothetical protein
MGLGDVFKQIKSWADQAVESQPQWARIVGIGGAVGPMTGFTLEIHYMDNPPTEVSTVCWVPRGVSPQIGQHVAFQRSTSHDNHTHYEILWDQPPRYGTGQRPNVIPDQVRDRMPEDLRRKLTPPEEHR